MSVGAVPAVFESFATVLVAVVLIAIELAAAEPVAAAL